MMMNGWLIFHSIWLWYQFNLPFLSISIQLYFIIWNKWKSFERYFYINILLSFLGHWVFVQFSFDILFLFDLEITLSGQEFLTNSFIFVGCFWFHKSNSQSWFFIVWFTLCVDQFQICDYGLCEFQAKGILSL